MQITCPSCQFTQYVPDDKIPLRSKVATCPECGNRFQFRELADVPDADELSQGPADSGESAHGPAVPQQQPPYYGPDGKGLDKPQLEHPLEDDAAADRFDEQAPQDNATPDANDEAQSDGMSAAERYLASKGADAPEDTSFENMHMQEEQPSGPVQVEVPFEDLENFGFFSGMFQTIKRACLSPRLFFSVMPLRGVIRPTVFAILLVEFMFVMGAFWQLSGMPDLQTMLMEYQGMPAPTVEETLNPVLLFAIVPILSLVNLFFNTVVVHGVLALVGGGKRGFEGTLRVLAYSQAPLILSVIPFGVGVAVFWSLAISIIGIKNMHSTDWGRTILAHILLMVALAFIFFAPFLPATAAG